MENAPLTALLVSAVIGLTKIVEMVLEKLFTKKSPSARVVIADPETKEMISEIHESSRRLIELTAPLDRDGIPMIYSPRSTIEMQAMVAKYMAEISATQERILAHLDKHDDKIESTLHDIEKQIISRGALR